MIVRPQCRHTRVRIDVLFYVYVIPRFWWHQSKSGNGTGLVQAWNRAFPFTGAVVLVRPLLFIMITASGGSALDLLVLADRSALLSSGIIILMLIWDTNTAGRILGLYSEGLIIMDGRFRVLTPMPDSVREPGSACIIMVDMMQVKNHHRQVFCQPHLSVDRIFSTIL